MELRLQSNYYEKYLVDIIKLPLFNALLSGVWAQCKLLTKIMYIFSFTVLE